MPGARPQDHSLASDTESASVSLKTHRWLQTQMGLQAPRRSHSWQETHICPWTHSWRQPCRPAALSSQGREVKVGTLWSSLELPGKAVVTHCLVITWLQPGGDVSNADSNAGTMLWALPQPGHVNKDAENLQNQVNR